MKQPELRYTLIGDGRSDRRLLPALNWLLQTHSTRAISASWADFSVLGFPPKTLDQRIAAAMELFPADLLFVHRDAETESRLQRLAEIDKARERTTHAPVVPVIPIRMQEAWLLSDETAIRAAAGNPRGRIPLDIPPKASLEKAADPKKLLYDAIRTASQLTGRHLRRLNVAAAAYRVSELIEDYSILRGLSAFDNLEGDLIATLERYGLA